MARYFFSSILLFLIVFSLGVIINAHGLDLSQDLIWSIRLPRLITAALAGSATAAAGALSQSLFRNALATPSIIGTEAGAAFALALATLWASASPGVGVVEYPMLYTTFGAGLATIISLSLMRQSSPSFDSGNEGLGRLLLGGFALNALLAAGSSLCISILMEKGDGMSLYHWLMGSFSAKTWTHAAGLALSFGVCVILATRLAPSLDALSLGDDAARGIGLEIRTIRARVLLLIAALIGASLSCGGALPFVGLIAPHFARILTRPHIRTILPLASIIGATLAVGADLAARTLRAPVDMDVGILTTMIGAPYFIWLLMSDNPRGRGA